MLGKYSKIYSIRVSIHILNFYHSVLRYVILALVIVRCLGKNKTTEQSSQVLYFIVYLIYFVQTSTIYIINTQLNLYHSAN